MLQNNEFIEASLFTYSSDIVGWAGISAWSRGSTDIDDVWGVEEYELAPDSIAIFIYCAKWAKQVRRLKRYATEEDFQAIGQRHLSGKGLA